MSVQIDVALDEAGPARIRMTQRDRRGNELALERSDPYLVEAEQHAYDRLLDAGQRLPTGTIDVVVGQDPVARYPASAAVGRAIARRALAA